MARSNDDMALVLDRLTKKYGDFTALDGLSLQLERGKILGLLGPNGAGKTTTIKILVGQARPTSGSAFIAGVDCTHDSRKIKRLVGYMPDTFGSYDNMRVREYLDFFGAAFGIPRSRRGPRLDEVMELTGCTYMKDRYLESLSHGMKQRVGLARTLVHDPAVLILDEPAGGLDPIARIEMRDALVRLAQAGKTLIVTSHILPELSRICDQIAILTHGKLRALGTVSEILRQVRQQRMIEVQLSSVEHVDRAVAVIKSLVEADAQVTPSPAELMVRFRTRKSEDAMGQLLARLVVAEVRVNEFREVQSDLEDTFLEIARSSLPSGDREPAPAKQSVKGPR